MKKYFLSIFVALELFASSFGGAGGQVANIELSDSERLIFKNQKAIQANKKELMKLKLKLNAIKENVDGMKSLLESTNEKISQTTQKNANSVSSDEIKKLKKRVDEIERENSKRFKKIEKSIEKLISLLSSSKTTTTPKKLKPPKEGVTDSKKKKVTKKQNKKEKKLSAKEAFLKAEKLFKRKKYKEALDNYLIASSKKYNLYNTYFKMGECFYYQKKYDEAIAFYKKSVNLKDDSKFLPKLLLHTGISFKNKGDKEGAKKFLNTVKSAFPNSVEAKLATKYLKNL
jgi:TolA-binding protein